MFVYFFLSLVEIFFSDMTNVIRGATPHYSKTQDTIEQQLKVKKKERNEPKQTNMKQTNIYKNKQT